MQICNVWLVLNEALSNVEESYGVCYKQGCAKIK